MAVAFPANGFTLEETSPPLLAETNRLENELEVLHLVIDSLNQRLNPLLPCEAAAKDVQTPRIYAGSSPFVRRQASLADRVESAATRLRDINGCLEL